jgi:uncharacterized protein
MARSHARFGWFVVAAIVASGCLGSSGPQPPLAPDPHLLPPVPGSFDLTGNWSKVLEPGPFPIGSPEILWVTSEHDGIALPLLLFRPIVPTNQRVPIIVEFSPYWPDMLSVEALLADPELRHPVQSLVDNFVPHGYAVALVATRGTSNAGGCMDALGPAERSDIDQLLDWLGEQPWSSGRVGAIGHSQSGGNAWLAAATGNKYLATIVVNAAFVDLFQVAFRNGTNGVFGSPVIPLFHAQAAFTRTGFHPEHALCPVVAEAALWSATATATGERDPGGFWAERDLRSRILENYRGSVLVSHGLKDWLVTPSSTYPFVNELERSGIEVKHLLGQWEHKYPDWNAAQDRASRWDWAEILRAWWDRHLKQDAAVTTGAGVEVQDTQGWWRTEDAWPPQDSAPRTFYLAPADRLLDEPSSETGSVVVSTSSDYYPQPFQRPVREDAVSAFPCLGCPRFSTERLPDELRFAGPVKVPLRVTSMGAGGALTAHLYVVYPAAWYGIDQIPVIERLTSGMIDLRFADGTESPKPVVPGQPLSVALQLEPIDAVLPAGGRLVLELAQAGYGERVPTFTSGPMQVAIGGDASRLEVFAFERDEGRFFLPPGHGP